MRLYSLTGATAVDDGGHHYEPGPDGGFDFPEDLTARLHPVAVRGQRQWEDAVERQHRLIAEEAERRRDPAELLAAVERSTAALAKLADAAEAAPAAGPPAARKPRQPTTRKI